MAAGTQTHGWDGVSRRRVPRFQMQAPVDVTVSRSEGPDTVPGRSVNVCERGIAAMIAGELTPGETVRIDLVLSPAAAPLRTMAVVRYHDKLRCGFEFLAMSPQDKSAIRDWARGMRAETEMSMAPSASAKVSVKPAGVNNDSARTVRRGGPGGPKRKIGRGTLLIALVVVAVSAGVFWWRWNRGWEELEAGLKNSKADSAEAAPLQVPIEVMQKLLVHKVEPVYPDEARQENVEGIIALDIVVSREGSVTRMRPLNGPDVLARAAMDALRWWKFSPYRVNGNPVAAETTVAVEFKR